MNPDELPPGISWGDDETRQNALSSDHCQKVAEEHYAYALGEHVLAVHDWLAREPKATEDTDACQKWLVKGISLLLMKQKLGL